MGWEREVEGKVGREGGGILWYLLGLKGGKEKGRGGEGKDKTTNGC